MSSSSAHFVAPSSTGARPWRPKLFQRVPYVPQLEMAECGVACLAMVLRYLGAAVPLAELRLACGVSRNGATVAAIVAAAKQYGVRARAVKVGVRALPRLQAPAVLHWNFNHFVVLERASARGATIVDPASGRRRVSPLELQQSCTGVAITFSLEPHFQRRAERGHSFARHAGVLAKCRSGLIAIMIVALLLEVVTMVFPASDQILIDHVLLAGRSSWLIGLVSAVTVAAAAAVTLTALRDALVHKLAFQLDLVLVTSFVKHLLRLPIPFFAQRTSGDLMQRVEANGELRSLATQVLLAVLDLAMVLGYSALMLLYDVVLGSVVIALTLLRIVLVVVLSRPAGMLTSSELASAGAERTTAIEAFSIPETVRAFAAEELLTDRFVDKMTDRLNASLMLRRFEARNEAITGVFEALSSAAILWLGGNAVLEQRMSLGVLVGFFALRLFLQKPLLALVSAVTAFIYMKGIMSRLDDVLDTKREASGLWHPGVLRGAIELTDVSYAHSPHEPPVCDGISLRIAPGEKIAIVGSTGAGKTTLAQLIVGLLAPTRGAVLYDGIPLSELDSKVVRRQLGVVLQEVWLFEGSVRDNLTLGADVDDRALRRAARLACIDTVIDALPHGYDTVLVGEGAALSGGQRQRLSLARALVRQPKVLVLDEATSSLDLETERTVHANLAALGCTRILIAHRLATVRDADRILVLDRGRIVQAGTFDELSRAPGIFQDMVMTLG